MGEITTLGKRLKAFRELAGLSQRALAEKAGVRRAMITMLENGTQTDTTAQSALALATALGITVDMLMRDHPLQRELAAAIA